MLIKHVFLPICLAKVVIKNQKSAEKKEKLLIWSHFFFSTSYQVAFVSTTEQNEHGNVMAPSVPEPVR